MLKTSYLVGYNGVMCAGWAMLLAKVAQHYAAGGAASTLYPVVSKLLCVVQTGALLEVLHALVGLVRSPVLTTMLQVASRLFVLYGTLRIGENDARRGPAFTQMIVAWALSEIIRYGFYTTNLLETKSKLLKWLRYSAFTLLYPLGISGEVISIVKAMPYIKENNVWSLSSWGTLGSSLSLHNFMWITLLGFYPIGSYVMYTYMLTQRRKAMRSEAVAATNSTHKHR